MFTYTNLYKDILQTIGNRLIFLKEWHYDIAKEKQKQTNKTKRKTKTTRRESSALQSTLRETKRGMSLQVFSEACLHIPSPEF